MSDVQANSTAQQPDFFLSALAACGDSDPEAVGVVERYLFLSSKLDRLQWRIAEIMARSDRPGFHDKCRKEFQAQREFVDLQIRELLDGWSPSLWRHDQPN